MHRESGIENEGPRRRPPRRIFDKRRGVRWVVRVGVVAAVAFGFWMSGCMERMFYQPTRGPTPLPVGAGRAGAEAVWFESADGTRLRGWFISAIGRGGTWPAPAPAILHVHGNAGNIESHVWFTEYLPVAGFNVLIFDYRGYGESEGVARRRGPLIEDTEAALDYLLGRGDVDRTRIGMYGQSLGGAIGLNVMAKRPEIRVAVIESAFASWREMAGCAIGGDEPNFACRSLASMLIPDTHRPDAAIAKIDRPMLLLHGSADGIIPISHSRKLAAANTQHAKLIELNGADHNSLRETHPEIEQVVIDFFRRELETP